MGFDCVRLVGQRQEGQHRDVADDGQRDSDAEADERELRAIGAVRRVHVAQDAKIAHPAPPSRPAKR